MVTIVVFPSHPAEFVFAIKASHVIAAFNFLDSAFALRAVLNLSLSQKLHESFISSFCSIFIRMPLFMSINAKRVTSFTKCHLFSIRLINFCIDKSVAASAGAPMQVRIIFNSVSFHQLIVKGFDFFMLESITFDEV
jgi:uncharacterized membrane protein